MKGAAAFLVIALAAPACANAAAAPDYARVANGRYQAILADCMGCHTAPGGRPFAGGTVLETPFGKLAAPNITPDDSGIAGWTREEFRRAVKSGMAPGGRRLYPAMPYPSYARMRDSDVDDLFTYLQTVAPVRYTVPVNLLRFPFNIRGLMAGWNWLFFKPQGPQPRPGKSAAWNRGEYLVNGPGHCGVCHTPKNLFGADKSHALGGVALAGWFAPDISNDPRTGVGGWGQGDMVAYLATGRNSHAAASGPMAEVIENSTSRMNDGDLAAIAVYLKSLPGGADPRHALAAGDARMKRGAQVYDDNCRACHNADGRGQSVIFPPLAGSAIVQQEGPQSLTRVVLAGTQAAQTARAPTAAAMPSFAWRLSDAEVADVLTYIRNSWGNAAPAVAASAVKSQRESSAH